MHSFSFFFCLYKIHMRLGIMFSCHVSFHLDKQKIYFFIYIITDKWYPSTRLAKTFTWIIQGTGQYSKQLLFIPPFQQCLNDHSNNLKLIYSAFQSSVTYSHSSCFFYTVHEVLKESILWWFAFFPPVYYFLSELSAMIHLSWVLLHGMAHSFIELCKPLRQCNEHEFGQTLGDGEG